MYITWFENERLDCRRIPSSLGNTI